MRCALWYRGTRFEAWRDVAQAKIGAVVLLDEQRTKTGPSYELEAIGINVDLDTVEGLSRAKNL